MYEILYESICNNFLILRIFSLANTSIRKTQCWLLRVLELKVHDPMQSDFVFQAEVSWLVRVNNINKLIHKHKLFIIAQNKSIY